MTSSYGPTGNRSKKYLFKWIVEIVVLMWNDIYIKVHSSNNRLLYKFGIKIVYAIDAPAVIIVSIVFNKL